MPEWKKLFERSKIKTAEPIPTPEIHPYSDIMVSSDANHSHYCVIVQQYIDCYVISKKADIGCENRLYVGDLDQSCPGVNLYVQGQNCGQIYGVGDVFDDRTTIVIKTETGNYCIRKQKNIHEYD